MTVPSGRTEDRGYEQRDVRVRVIVLAGAALLISAFVISVLMWFFIGRLAEQQAAQSRAREALAAAQGRKEPPAPRLQARPIEDLHELRAEEESILQSYGWVDRKAGVVRIPIDRAMKLMAERNAPRGAR